MRNARAGLVAGGNTPLAPTQTQSLPGTATPSTHSARIRRRHWILSVLLLTLFWLAFPAASAPAQASVVRAVLFFSPTCSHCQQVMREIPEVFERYGGPGQVWNETGLSQEELAFFQISNGNLQFLMVNVSLTQGRNFYDDHTVSAGIPEGRLGVPRMAIAGDLLVGSQEILTQLPGIIERGLANGGSGWPQIAGLAQIVAATGSPPVAETQPEPTAPAEPVTAETPGAPSDDADQILPVASAPEIPDPDTDTPAQSDPDPAPRPVADAVLRAELEAIGRPAFEPSASGDALPADPSPVAAGGDEVVAVAGPPSPAGSTLQDLAAPEPTMLELYRRDPVGNALAVLVLVAMITSVVAVARSRRSAGADGRLGPVVPILALIGMGVAAYLTHVETSGVAAVCGPVGNCNAVQQSEYAKLFGLVPVGALGLAGYAAIIAAWIVARLSNGTLATRAVLVIGTITVAGTLFSIYLTFLEPFVIGATCAWCLTSAVLITVLMVISMKAAKAAWMAVRSGHQNMRAASDG